MILLGFKKITRFIIDVTNARDKECLADIKKVLITGKAILTESELKSVRNSTWLFTAQNNSVYGSCVLLLRKHYYVYIYTNKLEQLYTNKLKWLCKQCTVSLKGLCAVYEAIIEAV